MTQPTMFPDDVSSAVFLRANIDGLPLDVRSSSDSTALRGRTLCSVDVAIVILLVDVWGDLILFLVIVWKQNARHQSWFHFLDL